ncbi:MAG TPA: 2-oxoacid:acceptor oxidoreductase family protein [Spirochaetota bacterium]|nr:2-oxoacid:acceptor oxidoreductase family protein [Spirochaetota bacterium]
MKNLIEIRWHGRGGQGTVTAAKVFADACLSGGRHIQAFPEYGPERSGAPLKAYNRISSEALRKHCPVLNPDIVVVVDSTLLDGINVAEGTHADTVYLVNTNKSADETKQKIGLKDNQKLFCLDGTQIAIDSIGRALPNSTMVGALAKISSMLSLDKAVDGVERSFGKKFSRAVIDGNLSAAKRGWEEVKEV